MRRPDVPPWPSMATGSSRKVSIRALPHISPASFTTLSFLNTWSVGKVTSSSLLIRSSEKKWSIRFLNSPPLPLTRESAATI